MAKVLRAMQPVLDEDEKVCKEGEEYVIGDDKLAAHHVKQYWAVPADQAEEDAPPPMPGVKIKQMEGSKRKKRKSQEAAAIKELQKERVANLDR